ncbi:endonuclease/exonuclease/phosphatase family protein [Luteolibacter flavescens]|uniref:Endonuclease/exonuclease/phosphatase family protein n=1 Tax=Luteolibacter flavescens TaxID=1859460 RepID=A0ABT3FQZ4_9BACT|nr:endonuclease/exonuclease/phosphatase family protein [Luteolibacter flavescens]MCW1886001.1 endonuclease/exonuclease/phosphatase family protein [Luteolibacter flavescens]
MKLPKGEADHPGLIIVQIDGLSRTQFEHAISKGNLPFLSKLIRREHFTVESFYSGVPSTTPAVQGEIFYGVRAAVPGFQFLHRASGKVMRMYEAESAAVIEDELRSRNEEPLLQDGSSYSNIYRAGASFTRYCSQDLASTEVMRRANPLKWFVLGIAYLPKLLRMAGLAALEFVIAIADAFKGLYAREKALSELLFVPARVVVCIILREAVRFRILLDIERGVPVIHGNLLGYDEQSHRRGPRSEFAHWTLKGIDRAIRDIYRAGDHSVYRDYEVIIYSDHGQEHTVPYERKHGRELHAALAEVFSSGPMAGTAVWMRRNSDLLGNTVGRFRNLVGLRPDTSAASGVPQPDSQVIVTAMGPLGHIYFPRPLTVAELEGYVTELIRVAGVPLVLRPQQDGTVQATNARGTWSLPAQADEVLGASHPFLEEVAQDLVSLCFHENAGDLVISGWNPNGQPLSFPMENGAHCGPGSEETRGFLLVPDRIRRWHHARLPATGARVRGEDLHKIVRHFLNRDGIPEEKSAEKRGGRKELSLRVMTYNIHSCVGLDRKIRPERVARVINHFDPDIVAVQEVDCHRVRSRGHDQAQLIAEHLRMSHVFHAMFEEERERYGIAIFSRYPLTTVKSGYLTEADPRLFKEARGAIWVKVATEEGRSFHFLNTHFGLGRAERLQQAEVLLGDEWLGSLPATEPVVVAGDFNSGPRSRALQGFQRRFQDVQRVLPGHVPIPTFSSAFPLLRIDHLFVSKHFTVDGIGKPVSPVARMASDHLPLFAELTLQ